MGTWGRGPSISSIAISMNRPLKAGWSATKLLTDELVLASTTPRGQPRLERSDGKFRPI
jgi:hypothetical protein